MRFTTAFLFSLCILLSESGDVRAASLPEGSWTLSEVGNSKILTDAPAKTARKTAFQFSVLREIILEELAPWQTSSNRAIRPHYVFLTKSAKLFSELAPIRPNDSRSIVPGFYLQADFNPLILAQVSNSSGYWEVVYHEYTHRILHTHFNSLPSWAEEGLAELFASLTITPKNVRLTRSRDRTRRYADSLSTLIDWKKFFATTNHELKNWIIQNGVEAQAYYAQAALLAEFAHYTKPNLKTGYWELIDRSRYKPITELDAKLLLGLDFSELDQVIRKQLKTRFNVSKSIIQSEETFEFTTTDSSSSSTAAILAIAYTRGGKQDHAHTLLSENKDLKNPLWLAAMSETSRALDNLEKAYAYATQALNTQGNDPFLITLSAFERYITGDFKETDTLESLEKAHSLGDTSAQMYNLYFEIASRSEIPFERFAPICKEGALIYPDIEYARELNRIEADRILRN